MDTDIIAHLVENFLLSFDDAIIFGFEIKKNGY
jgi:hypothetical protein